MKNVVFVAPYFLDATERFISAAVDCPDARVGLVSCDPLQKLKPVLRSRLAAHYSVPSISTSDLRNGVQAIREKLGGCDVMLGMLEQIQEPLGAIREQLGIRGMTAATARNFRDKSQMKNVLRAAGLPCASHQLVTDVGTGLAFARQTGFPLIVKPPDGAGAQGTYRCEDEQGLRQCLENCRPTAGNPILLEEFITGQEHSFDSIFVGGQMVWSSISHYFPGPLEVVREPWIQWCVIIPRETDAPRYQRIKQAAPASIQALGLQTGLSHLEWFRRPDDSIAISEVGARPPGAQFTSLLSYAHDMDFYKAWAELMIHERFAPPERKYACGAAYLRGMGQGKIAHVRGLDVIGKEFGSVIVEAKIPQQGQSPSGTYEGEGFIIVRHPETSVVERALTAIINTVRVELM